MKSYFITFRSVTPAQRGENTLRRAGMECSVQRTPRFLAEKGCGYCLRFHQREVPRAVEILRQNQVPFSKVYRVLENGAIEELTV